MTTPGPETMSGTHPADADATRHSAETFLRLRGVTKRFGDHVAVAAIDLDIRRGEFVTLLGPSGCGKTTLLRMIAGFEHPSAGTIELEGTDLTRRPPERRPLNMVFQSYALFPHMNVFDNVAYGLRTAGSSEKEVFAKVHAALELVGLEKCGSRRVNQLSGGMSQRVALVRAIVNEPAVLLLDEPLGALDLQLRKRMQVELRAIQDRIGTTFIYVTHDQEEALVMSHRVVLMHEGRIVQIGAPADVYHRPTSRFVAEFVGEASLLPGVVASADRERASIVLAGGTAINAPYYVSGTLAAGDAVHLVLRPEHLRLGDPDAATFRGVLSDAIFIGSATHYVVTLPAGSQLRVAGDDDTGLERGGPVGVDLVPGRGAVVRAEESVVDDAL